MAFTMFIASDSFFLGQARVFPKANAHHSLLAIPALLPLVFMLYWLARVWFMKRYPARA